MLDFLVFSDKDEKKKKVPSHSTFTYLVFVGSKSTRHCSKRVGDVGPGGGVVNLSWARWVDYPVRRDINIGITSGDPPSGVVMATYRQPIWRTFTEWTAAYIWTESRFSFIISPLIWLSIKSALPDHENSSLAAIIFSVKLRSWADIK